MHNAFVGGKFLSRFQTAAAHDSDQLLDTLHVSIGAGTKHKHMRCIFNLGLIPRMLTDIFFEIWVADGDDMEGLKPEGGRSQMHRVKDLGDILLVYRFAGVKIFRGKAPVELREESHCVLKEEAINDVYDTEFLM